MRACPRCMAENLDTDRFCKRCASPLQQSAGKTCPSGRHTMDPTWTECVYCKQESVVPRQSPPPPARFATVVENQTAPRGQAGPVAYKEETPLPPRPARPLSPPSPPNAPVTPAAPFTPAAPAPQAAVEPPPNRQRTNTVYRPLNQPVSDPGQTAPSAVRDRKIVGVLVTYSWNSEGQIYPIREGRNFIGRDKDCEVCIPEDQTLSGKNSHITYRQNFVVGDLVSMAGTDLDGVPIEEQFHSLANYATIRAGSTYFTFIAVEPRSPGAESTVNTGGGV
jgi:hypothetical protein